MFDEPGDNLDTGKRTLEEQVMWIGQFIAHGLIIEERLDDGKGVG
ncbi:MAG: hypothetical protein U5L00_13905 [Desulfovermiculus sp.]|nr:hypothetical protein [Desulfovermiculus sp.]